MNISSFSVVRVLLTALLATLPSALAQTPAPADLNYGGTNFRALAAESYQLAHLNGDFSTWLATAYTTAGVPLEGAKTLDAALAARKAALDAAKTPAQKDALARDTAAWAHRFIKQAVPRFSLERGYEFASIVKTGERQCLLQSTIIAGLLQKVGLNAGLVMVWKSMSGQESNLGHVTSVLRLPSGAGDLEVDASEPEPFATHSGLLTWADGSYRFVNAEFDKTGLITAYAQADGRARMKLKLLSFLPLNYIRSQYDYYRAERATGGVLGTGTGKSTADGLKVSESYLLKSLSREPANPLAASVLGTVYRKEGREADARTQYRKAAALYTADGHMPAGMLANLKWANGQGQ